MSTKIEQLDWRRSKVVELRVRGLSQTEIARELQVSKASISLDMQYLRSQAKENIKEYVTEHLPEQYQVCLTALDAIIKRAFDILKTLDDKHADAEIPYYLFHYNKDYDGKKWILMR